MGVLYLKKSPKWVNYLSNEELNDFIEMYTGNELVIGDLAAWSNTSIQKLLKLVETYPKLSVYSSRDLFNPILYSRFPSIIKSPGTAYVEDPNPISYNNLLQNSHISATERLHARGHSPLRGTITI